MLPARRRKVECIEGVLRADGEGQLKIFWLDNKFQSPSALGYRDVNLGVGLQVRNLINTPTNKEGVSLVGRDVLKPPKLLSITHLYVPILTEDN